MNRRLRWGILGTGNIARQFVDSFASSTRGILTAVGSRKAESARAFAEARKIPAAFGSYDELIACPDVDAVYLSLPNSMHHEWTLKALAAGKHVLCEKPVAANQPQAQEMFDVAQKHGLHVIEAFMYRSHPMIRQVKQAVDEGRLGRLKVIRTSFCFRVWNPTGNIRFDPTLAGGALMDIGCYCINFSRFFAGAEPISVQGIGQLHSGRVDELACGILRFPGDLCATFSCGMAAQADNTASICGDEGYIEIPVPWKPPVEKAIWNIAYSTPPKMDLATGAARLPRPKESFAVDAGKGLFAMEADDFADTVFDGRPPVITPQDSLGNMRVLDELRRQLGVRV